MVKEINLEAHLAHVVCAGAAHAVGNHLGLFDDLLDGELADDAAQVSFHDQADEAFAFGRVLREELFGRGEDRLLVGADLDLRDSFHGNGDALFGVEILLRSDVERHQLKRELAAVFDDREDDGAVALDDAGAAKSIDDQRLVGAGLAKHLGHQREQENGGERRQSDNHNHCVWHNVPCVLSQPDSLIPPRSASGCKR